MKKTMLEGVFSQEGKPLADEQLSQTAKVPYEAPVTMRTLVETEGSFCGSVIEKDDAASSDITTSTHDVQTGFTDTQTGETIEDPFDFSNGSWN